ncbi:MAG: undecaprenyl-phosphate glucose phosphotransferase [Chloroflexi bacterium]|nr:undecaprenyl-phosphate glucose phosphotransferase [Chloroflexota bacterium]
MSPRRHSALPVIELLAADFIGANVALLLAHYLRFDSGAFSFEELHPLQSYFGIAVFQTLILPVVFAINGLYRPRRTIGWLDEVYGVLSAYSVTSLLVVVASALIWREFGPSRLLVALLWVLGFAMIAGLRIVIFGLQVSVRARGLVQDRLLVVGSGEIAGRVVERLNRSRGHGYVPVGCLTEPGADGGSGLLPVLGTTMDLVEVIRTHRVDDVIVATSDLSHEQLVEIVSLCQAENVNIRVYPDLFQILSSGVETMDLGGLPLLTIRDTALRGWNIIIKRAMDLVGGALLVVLFSGPMLLIGLLVRLSSPRGPVFHIQERVGLDGRPFLCIKFRSMRPDAESGSGPVWATADDPRRTRLGAFLRRYSLDELPQFLNVLFGEMSLVGPRPERPFFVERFRRSIPRYWDRHREKAGITGWAQVNGMRGNTSIEERTAYDLWYVENWTPWLDLKILLRTPFSAISDKNAY